LAFWLITKLKCAVIQRKNNDTKDYSKQLEFLNSESYYASKKIVNQSSDFPVRHTGSYRHKKALPLGNKGTAQQCKHKQLRSKQESPLPTEPT